MLMVKTSAFRYLVEFILQLLQRNKRFFPVSPPMTDPHPFFFPEISRTSAWPAESWTTQTRPAPRAPGRPLMCAAHSVTLGLRTARGGPQLWSSGLAERPVRAVAQMSDLLPEFLGRRQKLVKNLHGNLQTARFLGGMWGERCTHQRRERVLDLGEMGWRRKEVWGRGGY